MARTMSLMLISAAVFAISGAESLFAAKPAVVQAKKPAAVKKRAAAAAKERLEALRRLKQLQQLQAAAQSGQSRRVTSGTLGVREDVDVNDNTEQLLLLSPRGPILVELAITLDGKPFRTAREKLISEMLKQSDTDKNGTVTWKEALDNPRFAFGRLSSSLQIKNPAYRDILMKRYDIDKDGNVSRYEVRLMLAQFGYGTAFQVTTNYYTAQQPDVKSILDTDGDGIISVDELQAAPTRLKSRDANDNDLLEAAELGGTAGSRYSPQRSQRGMRLPTRGREAYLMGPAADLAAAYAGIVAKYGNKDKQVTAEAFRTWPGAFKTLDLNKNGVFDTGESIGLHLMKPQLKLKVELAVNDTQSHGITVTSITRTLSNESKPGKASEQLSLALPGWKLRFLVPGTVSQKYDYTRTAQSMLARYDKNKNGYIEKTEMGSNSYYQRQFDRWDINNDGKVFVDEIKEMYDQMQAPQRSKINVSTWSQGPSLFAALDESGDNRLSAREIKNAGTRLLALDTNKNGVIDPDEMPSEASIRFMQGGTAYRQTSRVSRTTPKRSRGPKWFVHMDKNSDGDITLREFLGTKQKFDELDTNHDGFIERMEAEAVVKGQGTSAK